MVAAAAGAAQAGEPSADGMTRVLDLLQAAHARALAKDGNANGIAATAPPVGELSLVLVMARDIPGDHLGHGFLNSVVARLPAVDKRAAALQLGGTGSAANAGSDAPVSAALDSAAGASARAAALASGKAAAGVASVATPATPPAAAGSLSELAAFSSAFNGRAFRTGDEVIFTWRPDAGVLKTAFRQATEPSVAGSQATLGAPELPIRGVLRTPGLARALFEVYAGAPASAPVSPAAKAAFERVWEAAMKGGSVVVESRGPPPPADALLASLREAAAAALPAAAAAALLAAAPEPRSGARCLAVDSSALAALAARDHSARTSSA